MMREGAPLCARARGGVGASGVSILNEASRGPPELQPVVTGARNVDQSSDVGEQPRASHSDRMRGEVIETADEMPRLSSIRKKRKAHRWGSGIRPKAMGKI
eukprot:scaffold1112_cov116-Isochrysis_galbana.AAC.15